MNSIQQFLNSTFINVADMVRTNAPVVRAEIRPVVQLLQSGLTQAGSTLKRKATWVNLNAVRPVKRKLRSAVRKAKIVGKYALRAAQRRTRSFAKRANAVYDMPLQFSSRNIAKGAHKFGELAGRVSHKASDFASEILPVTAIHMLMLDFGGGAVLPSFRYGFYNSL